MKRVALGLTLAFAMACGSNGGNGDKDQGAQDIDAWWLEAKGDLATPELPDLKPGDVELYDFPRIEDHKITPPEVEDKVSPPDEGTPDEVEEKDEYVPPVGETGAPCTSGTQCNSGLCLEARQGMKCSGPCSTETPCPQDFVCMPFPGVEGTVCVPGKVNLCRPCTVNEDCMSNGVDVGDKCVSLGAKGAFCGGACEGGTACPTGFECHGMTDKLGKPSDQCVMTSGDCACSEKFVQQGAWTLCYNQNLLGKCEGDRFCTATGLSACSAPIPEEELCNGKDDDCDGQVDEGVVDTDKDGIPDCVDEDDDADNVADFADNCPLNANPGQEDFDKDLKGDACDDDDDGDGDPDTSDCAKYDATIFHGAQEICDGLDNDCEGGVPVEELDKDGDGVRGCDGDCNDNNNQVFPTAQEDCATSFDDNCDNENNPDDALNCKILYKDEDGDGYGSMDTKCRCVPEPPYLADNSFDCDDTKKEVHPGGYEDCSTAAVDENCDGSFNQQDGLNCKLFYKDGDSDGYGVAESICACEKFGVYSADNVLDCNDNNAQVNPKAKENCLTFEVDDNCNGTANDMDAQNCDPWFEDKDGDGFGVGIAVCICQPQSVYTAPNGEDCNDTNKDVYPGRKEQCSTDYDDNCNKDANEADAEGCTPWWVDQDGDGYAGTQICYCKAPANAEDYPEDCCDADPNAHPNQTKYFSDPVNWCNGYDYNCDGSEESQYNSSCVEAPCSAGWFQPTPGCGVAGNWCLNCAGCGSCIGQTIQQKQKCR